ncbi:Pre-mRNA splicing factor-domain-containing protein [Kockiozyma suomiensis]|uniref:Pre-mRNA splicing factor-domain-containing protein n=1 Tax=Kockiozyma suomiensis TaxID=1337062 RepID=UPI003343A984
MGGDLNLKKSWHPGLMRNQEAVWKREQEALEERKRTAERQREIQEERERNELLALQNGGQKPLERVEWMYAAPQGGNLGVSDEVEAFLMGKNTIEELLNQSEAMGTMKENEQESFVANGSAVSGTSSRDIAAKVREDPMLVIKKEQQAVINAIRNNPDRLSALKQTRPSTSRSYQSSEGRHSSDRHETTSSSRRHRDRSVSPGRRDHESRRNSNGRDRHESSHRVHKSSSSSHGTSGSSHRHHHRHGHSSHSSREGDRYRERDMVRVRD